MTGNNRWIVLDRDGVINRDADDFIKSVAEWVPLPGSIEAIAKLSQAGYNLVVATNQSGLGRGLFDLDDLEAMHRKMENLIQDAGGNLAGIFYCPHTPQDNCNCRKPRSGLFDSIEVEFACDLSGAYAVGDSLRDLEVAIKKNCRPILVLTGKGKKTQEQIRSKQAFKDIPVFANLQAFTQHLIN